MTWLLRFRPMLATVAAFALFAMVYGFPVWSEGLSAMALPNDQVAQGLQRALAEPAVQAGLALNLLTHLGLLVLLYAVLAWLSRCFALATSVSVPVAGALTFAAGLIWLVSLNALLFDHSSYSTPLASLARPEVAVMSSALLAAMIGVVFWHHRHQLVRARWWLGAAGLVASVFLLGAGAPHRTPSAESATHRNIIIVGVDSLSAPLLQQEQSSLPHLSRLLAHSTHYQRAYTPLGRTYPAWMSILSGRAPAEHGALFNLRAVERADRRDLLSRSLGAQGYRTVYAIDERRFNNIDESFGFDQLVGPQDGALDFALQSLNDTPLTNLLLQTRAGKWLLPHSYLNVASVANYDARGFVDAIGRASAGPAPLFLAVHFLSGHFPFHSRHAAASPSSDRTIRSRHVATLAAVDAQVGALMTMLSTQGRLDDALVILLSDHGEALGHDEPVRLASGELRKTSSFGHGTDLLSEHQNRIVLATARYRNGQPLPAGPAHDEQVSLLDIRAAAEAYARAGSADLKPTSDCMLVETGLRVASASDYRHLDPRQVAAEGAGFYEVDPQGRLRLREPLLRGLVAKKDVGLRCADRITIFKANEARHRAWRLSTGEPPQEAEPRTDDVARIEAYRRALAEQASGLSAATRRDGSG